MVRNCRLAGERPERAVIIVFPLGGTFDSKNESECYRDHLESQQGPNVARHVTCDAAVCPVDANVI